MSRSRTAGSSLLGPSLSFSCATRSRWAAMPSSLLWSAASTASASSLPMNSRRRCHQLAGVFVLLVERDAHAQAKLGVVLEQRVGPGWAAAQRVLRPGRGRQVAAIDARTAGGVGDHRAVAIQLADQLEVGRFATAGAGARELEERLQQLHVLDVCPLERVGVRLLGQLAGRIPSAWRLLRAAGAAAPC